MISAYQPAHLSAPRIPLALRPQLAEAKGREDDWTGTKDAAARRRAQTRLNTRAYRKRKALAKKVETSNATTGTLVKSEALVECWDDQQQAISIVPTSRIEQLYNARNPLLRDNARRKQFSIVFPLCPDHLITLLQFNALRALAITRSLISGILVTPLDCDKEVIHVLPYPMKPELLPPTLLPTILQQTMPHGDWIDCFPCPEGRDRLIRAAGTFDEDELWADCIGGLYEGFPDDEIERRGIIAWSPPWDISGWEMSEGFLRKWGWLFKGLPRMYVEWKKTGLPRGYVRNLEAQIQALKAENDELRNLQGRAQGAGHISHAQAQAHSEFPSDDILPSGFLDRTSPYAPSDHDILMQDPFDIARLAISELLTVEDQNNLCNLYFTRCHPFVPILHKPSFSIDKDAHVSLSVFALASRHNPALATKSDIFYSLAKQTVQATFINPDMSTLTALILQAIYEIGMPNSSVHALTTVGSALSLASAFKLLRMEEQEANDGKPNRWMDRPVDWVDEEGRRRAFLMVLSLSRWMATIQEREMGFPVKREITVMLPISDELWFADPPSRPATRPVTEPITSLHKASDAGPFARFVQALGLFAKVSDFNQAYRVRSSSQNDEELSKIDSIVQAYLGSFPNTWRMSKLEGEYLLDPTTLALAHSALLLLHHPLALIESRAGPSKTRCSASAEEILDVTHVLQDVPNAGNYLLPHPLVLAARVRLLELVQRKGHYRGRDMDLIVKALLTFGKDWGMQEKLAEHAAKIEANTVPFGEPLTHIIPVTEQPVSRQKTAQFVPSMPRRSTGSIGRATFGTFASVSDQQLLGEVQSPPNANASLSNAGPSLNTMDASIFSSDIFDWAMGLGSEQLDVPDQ
ncbi:hypothetical protein H2200_008696 [Cladophialophora chaetospira]|uniref:Xylanolytic transcriptional activator regulatory domain-containing protein n=1 Tax=Cladophialophora chaetospira TaxID=386627 RepID=A0AA38X4V0_9EURO|nr:hypothetical protein H2200_008696 [Cladophialophora chaetospira]